MLSIQQITDFLISENFNITKLTKKKIELKSEDIDQYIYINKTAGKEPSSVVLNPIFLPLVNDLSSISGVVHKEMWYHSSNMTKFPKRINKGESPIPYGIPFGFETEIGLKAFLKILKKNANSDDPFEDVNAAETELSLVTSTERNALIKARIGQGPFRGQLIEYWKGCAVTGLSHIELLIASHIKPWRVATNQDRLSVFNGLLLSPNLDKAFDKGLISFGQDKKILISKHLKNNEANLLGINGTMQLSKIDDNHLHFLNWHKQNIFKS